MLNETITAIPGLRVGHVTNVEARTGCTVVLCETGATPGVDVRGSAPGTRETDAIRPGRHVQEAHAVLLTGGSAFGLDAAGGVMRFLEERAFGYDAGVVRVPIVPAAVIFDLGVGNPAIRPDAAMGHQACVDATSAPVPMGRLGAGTGATVGKTPASIPSDGGIGSALRTARSCLLVGAIAVVNAIGNVVDPSTGVVVAGARDPRTGDFVDVASAFFGAAPDETSRTNTTIGVVATNARLSPSEATRVAELAHDGLARAILPAHTTHDGDTIFVLATGEVDADLDAVGIMAADSFARAIVRAVVTDRPV